MFFVFWVKGVYASDMTPGLSVCWHSSQTLFPVCRIVARNRGPWNATLYKKRGGPEHIPTPLA